MTITKPKATRRSYRLPTQAEIERAAAIIQSKIDHTQERLDAALKRNTKQWIDARSTHRKELRRLNRQLEEVQGGEGVFRIIPATEQTAP